MEIYKNIKEDKKILKNIIIGKKITNSNKDEKEMLNYLNYITYDERNLILETVNEYLELSGNITSKKIIYLLEKLITNYESNEQLIKKAI